MWTGSTSAWTRREAPTGHIELVSDGPNELFDTMRNFSESAKRHLDYTKLQYGYCITRRCKEFYKGDSDEELFAAMGACLNHSMQQYGMGAKLEFATCHRHGQSVQVTALDQALATLFLTLIGLAAAATVYDLSANKKDQNGYLICFSIPSNWAKLTAPWPQNKMTARLIGLNGIRTISSLLVIVMHVSIPMLTTIENPYFFEELLESTGFNISGHCTSITQTFFLMSGILLTYTQQVSNERSPSTWRSLPRAILLRWLRLAPTYLAVMLFVATWYKFSSPSPFYQELVNSEVQSCRQNWPSMLFLYNNYNDQTQCLAHHWSTITDIHMQIIGLSILLLSPSDRVRNAALWVLFAVGLVVPGYVTYTRDLSGSFLPNGKLLQRIKNLWEDETINYYYKRTHTNIPVYVMGMGLGLLLYKWQKSSVAFTKDKKLYTYLYWLLVPVLYVIMSLNAIMFLNDGEPVALYIRVLIALFQKPAWGVVIALIILGMVFEIETVPVYRRVLEWPGWTPLMRLTYCTYNVHLSLIRYLAASKATVEHQSIPRVLENIFGVIGISFVLGTALWLLVEAPMANLVRNLFPEKKSILEHQSTPPLVTQNSGVPKRGRSAHLKWPRASDALFEFEDSTITKNHKLL